MAETVVKEKKQKRHEKKHAQEEVGTGVVKVNGCVLFGTQYF